MKPDGWLIEKKTTAAQLLLKQKFPLVDGLEDTSIIGPLVSPAFSEFVQVVNTKNHWVCLSTVGWAFGHINAFDSLGTQAKPVAIDHACRMLVCAESSVKMVNQ